MGKHKNFSAGYFRAMRAMLIGVSGGAIVGALVSKRRGMGALVGAGLGLLGAYGYGVATRPTPQKDKSNK